MRFFLATLAVVFGSLSALAADDSWVDRNVVTRTANVKLTDSIDGKQVQFELNGLVQRVIEEKDGRLRIRDALRKGWVEKADFILSQDALKYYTDLIQADKKLGWAWFLRGNAWANQHDYDKAFADYSEAIRLNPQDAKAWRNRGHARFQKQEYDKAIADYRESIHLDPKNEWTWRNRGDAWLEKEEYEKAIADYNEVIRLDPKQPWFFCRRGDIWLAKRDYDKAISDYSNAIRIDSNYSLAFRRRKGLVFEAEF